MYTPSGENTAHETQSVCPSIVCKHACQCWSLVSWCTTCTEFWKSLEYHVKIQVPTGVKAGVEKYIWEDAILNNGKNSPKNRW